MLKCWLRHSLFKAAGGLSHRHFCWGLVYTVIHTSNLFITVQDKEFIAKAVCWPVNYADITKVCSDAITENFVVENTRSRLITEEPLKKVDE